MNLGKLNYIYNLDKHQAANKGYYYALVYDSVERIRARAQKNPEDITTPSWFDKLITKLTLF